MKGEILTDFPTGSDVRYCPHSGNILKISLFGFFDNSAKLEGCINLLEIFFIPTLRAKGKKERGRVCIQDTAMAELFYPPCVQSGHFSNLLYSISIGLC